MLRFLWINNAIPRYPSILGVESYQIVLLRENYRGSPKSTCIFSLALILAKLPSDILFLNLRSGIEPLRVDAAFNISGLTWHLSLPSTVQYPSEVTQAGRTAASS